MKLDVQKSELDALLGLDERDWPRIRQIVAEVHNVDGRLPRMTRMLEARGYRTTVEQEELYAGSPMYNLYAIRPT